MMKIGRPLNVRESEVPSSNVEAEDSGTLVRHRFSDPVPFIIKNN